MATVQQLEAALLKAHKAGDTRGAKAIAAEIKRVRALPTAKPGRTASAVKGFLSGAADVPVTVGEYLVKGLGAIGLVPDSENVLARSRAGTAQSRAGLEPYRQANPNYFLGGEILGQTVASAPLISSAGSLIMRGGGAVAARGAPRVGKTIKNVGKAVQTGGVGAGRKSAQASAMTKTQRAAELTQRMTGGAIAGGGAAASTGQDISEGATFGAGLPVVASVLRRLGGKVADITKVPRIKAAEIIRQSLENNVDEARAAFADLSPDDKRLAEQVLIEAGVEPRTFFGLGKIAEERITPTPFAVTREAQEAERAARMASLAEGGTATETRAALDMARKDVNRATGPLRDEALARANVAGQAVPEAEQLAAAARQRADELTASGIVPRMRGLESRSRDQLDAMFQNPEFFTLDGPAARTGEIAEGAGQRADDAINTQIGLRDRARDMEDIVADLAAQGMQPLKVAPIVNEIRRMASAPGTRASTLQRRALTKAAAQLEGLADANGVIDARDLYQFRKSELGDIINVLMSARSQPPSGVKEAAAGLMSSIRPMLDDAIEEAGGVGFKDYLNRTRQGFEAVNRQELAGKAAQLTKESPDEMIALMAGERPQMVEDIMGKGTGQFDIEGLALADPRRYLGMKQTARELDTLNRMTALRGQGSGAAANLMVSEQPSRLARGLAAALFSRVPSVRIGVGGAEQTEQAFMAPRVQRELANAFLSGQNARNLIDLYPSSLRASEELSKLPPGMRNAIAQLAQRYALGNQEY